MKKITVVLLLLLLALAVEVAAADGARLRVPPGNAGATQYSETLPGATGEESADPTGPSSGGSTTGDRGEAGESPISGSTATQLESAGPEGEAALRLAYEGAPTVRGRGSDGGGRGAREEGSSLATGGDGGAGGGGGPTTLTAASGSEGSSGPGEILGEIVGGSSGGLGFGQPLILAAVLVGAGIYLVRRRDRSSGRT